jgi:hypothetical protein
MAWRNNINKPKKGLHGRRRSRMCLGDQSARRPLCTPSRLFRRTMDPSQSRQSIKCPFECPPVRTQSADPSCRPTVPLDLNPPPLLFPAKLTSDALELVLPNAFAKHHHHLPQHPISLMDDFATIISSESDVFDGLLLTPYLRMPDTSAPPVDTESGPYTETSVCVIC